MGKRGNKGRQAFLRGSIKIWVILPPEAAAARAVEDVVGGRVTEHEDPNPVPYMNKANRTQF